MTYEEITKKITEQDKSIKELKDKILELKKPPIDRVDKDGISSIINLTGFKVNDVSAGGSSTKPSASPSNKGTIVFQDDGTNATAWVANKNDWKQIGGSSGSIVKAYAYGQQSINDTTETKVTLDTELFDTNNEFADSRFTAKTAGKYLVYATVLWNSPVDQKSYQTFIFKNTTEVARGVITSSGTAIISSSATDIVDLAVDDYIEVKCYHNSGTGKNTYGGQSYTYITIKSL